MIPRVSPGSLASALLLLLLAAAALPGCSSADPAEACPSVEIATDLPLLGGDCDPIVPTQCGYPFPSNVYLVDDPKTVTGKHVLFGETTLPRAGKTPTSGALWTDSDGFSPGATILAHLPGATAVGLPMQDTLDASIEPGSPTVLLDAETGELVPHIAEIDERVLDEDDADRAFMIRPVVRLRDATRYIVAIRHVVDASGAPIAPSPAFAALRDGTSSCEPSVGLRRALYADIFDKLAAAGVARGDLQLAWDFTTASRESNTRRLLHMRDDALALVGPEGPEYRIDSFVDDPSPHVRRLIRGTMTVPLYLDQPGPGAKLVLDDDGLPKQNGTADYPFIVIVPPSVADGEPGALLQNGHGLLGSKEEGMDGYLAEIADATHAVAFSVDLIGMAHDDFDPITHAIVNDISEFRDVVGRQHQGVLNSLLAMRLMQGRFVEEPLVQWNGHSAIDPTRRYYRGDSQGGIFGTTYMAVSTDVTRGLLGEPGLPYSLLLNRSLDFGIYFVLLGNTYRTGRNIQLLIGLAQMTWDRTEPDGYVPYLREDPLPGTPAHEVLIHVAIGDQQVTPLGAHLLARTIGAKNLEPLNRGVWGIEDATGPVTGSAMVEFSFGLPESPTTDVPPSHGDDPHDSVRGLPAAYLQADEFFRTGVVRAYCDGPCDPQ